MIHKYWWSFAGRNSAGKEYENIAILDSRITRAHFARAIGEISQGTTVESYKKTRSKKPSIPRLQKVH